MVQIFHDQLDRNAHDRFQAWRRDNEDGFYLNRKTRRNGLLHRVDCWHVGGVDLPSGPAGSGSLTRVLKVCSLRADAIQRWATANSVAVGSCSHCAPVDLLDEFTAVTEESASNGSFDIEGISDARRRILGSIVQRQGQPVFRRRLLAAYGGRCAVTGCDVEPVLEAAHIVGYQGARTNHLTNGLLLRADIHTLFDLGLVAIEPTTMTVLVHSSLEQSPYAKYAGRKLRLPGVAHDRPSSAALKHHCEKCGLTLH
jgi:hypothetical protein